MTSDCPSPKDEARKAREERLAAELRENLRKRKAQGGPASTQGPSDRPEAANRDGDRIASGDAQERCLFRARTCAAIAARLNLNEFDLTRTTPTAATSHGPDSH